MTVLRTFRFRIAALSVALSAVVLAVFGASAWSLVRRTGMEHLDAQLREEVRRFSHESRRPDYRDRFERMMGDVQLQDGVVRTRVALVMRPRGGGESYRSANWPREIDAAKFSDPPEPPPQADAPTVDERPRRGPYGPPDGEGSGGPFRPIQQPGPPPPVSYGSVQNFGTESGNWRVGVGGTQRTTFVVALSLGPLEENLRQLTHAMIVAAVPGLVLVALVGMFLASRALRPVAALTAKAERINARGLDQRMPATREAAEFQRLTDVFNAMLDRLEQSFQQATRFSADAAHELKTPLAILQGQLEQSLREAADGSPQQKLCADLLEEVQRLKTIIRKLLLLSLADAGQLRLNLEPVNLAEVVENAAEDARILAPGLQVETDAYQAVTVQADPDLLAQVVQNLVSNAIKYNRDGGFIRIELAPSASGVRLAVTNSGDPIPPAHQPRLFDRFYRADSSRARTTEGVGLGLSLAREIARAHRGELALERSGETGTTFVLTLPV